MKMNGSGGKYEEKVDMEFGNFVREVCSKQLRSEEVKRGFFWNKGTVEDCS